MEEWEENLVLLKKLVGFIIPMHAHWRIL